MCYKRTRSLRVFLQIICLHNIKKKLILKRIRREFWIMYFKYWFIYLSKKSVSYNDLPLQILRVSQRIHRDYRLNPANSTIRDMNRFAKFLLQKMFEVSQTNKHLWMELCFWKTSREASEIVDGYGTQASSKKQKASFWCEEDEEKLTRVFHQLQEMQAKSL